MRGDHTSRLGFRLHSTASRSNKCSALRDRRHGGDGRVDIFSPLGILAGIVWGAIRGVRWSRSKTLS